MTIHHHLLTRKRKPKPLQSLTTIILEQHESSLRVSFSYAVLNFQPTSANINNEAKLL